MTTRTKTAVSVRLPKELMDTYREIARLSGVKIEQVLLVTIAMKVVADQSKEPLP